MKEKSKLEEAANYSASENFPGQDEANIGWSMSADDFIQGALWLLSELEKEADTSTIRGASGGMCQTAKELLTKAKELCGK